MEMNALINQLRNEHAVLVESLGSVQNVGVGSAESKQMLLKAKSALLAHLGKEDKELYPVLKKAGMTDQNIQRKLDSFGKDMNEITGFVLKFFENIENDKYSQLEFARDFGKMVSLLSGRISREENILYPLYEACL